jgi:hypothetical protein
LVQGNVAFKNFVLDIHGPEGTPFVFSPTVLFAHGEAGGWWDPSDMTSVFEDTAGTIPVTSASQPVGRVNDKSGNGNHLLLTNGNRPSFQQDSGGLKWLEFDGSNFEFITAAFTLIQPMTRVSAMRSLSYASGNRFMDGGIYLGAVLYCTGVEPGIEMYGTGGSGPADPVNFTTGVDHVVSEVWNGPLSTLQVDSNAVQTGGALVAGSTIAGLTVGADASGDEGDSMRWYGGVEIGRLLIALELANCQAFFGAKASLVL